MFERSSTIIKDGGKLSFEYVPKKLVHREEQMRRLETLFRPLAEESRPCSAFLAGSVGTGKTVTARRFCEDMRDHCAAKGKAVDVIFINCRMKNTEHGIIYHLLRHYDPGCPDRGFSAADMLQSLRKKVESSSRPLVVVLDEVDVLLKNSNRDLIYQLSRFNEGMRPPASVSLMMISQYSMADKIDEASVSSFKRANTVKFDRYTRSELRDIIESRAEEALVSGAMGPDVIDLLADIAREFGDARLAIELIEKAASIAEGGDGGRITPDDARSANAMIYSNVSESKLVDLDMKRKLALLAIARAMKKESEISITAAERTYAVVCEEYDQAARKHTQFWTYVQDMENIGLLATTVRNEAEGGRVTYISIQDIPPKELARKLENILDDPADVDEERY
ncbi:MAG: AAA family ATPase [Candidatus Methanoplasma sp.]|jgi:cell division control protein 6|nr:AAA family ATPase [Candidatus Methanoplasma sp.]